jgi:hypothetical protein
MLGAAALFSATTTDVLAQITPAPGDDALLDRTPIAAPYNLIGPALTPDATMLYSNITQTGSRFNPGTGGEPLGAGTQQDITFDDIPIPASRLGGATAVDVTRVTVGIRRAGNAPATDINLFWSTMTTNVTDPDTELDVPFFPIGTQSLAARNEAAFITEIVTFGDGASTLFTAPLNDTIFNGFGSFLLGLQFSNGDSLNGWRLTSGADVNANAMWIYDTDVAAAEGVFNFGPAPAPAATFYITVEGNPVPEPASLGVLAFTGLLGLRRRRN